MELRPRFPGVDPGGGAGTVRCGLRVRLPRGLILKHGSMEAESQRTALEYCAPNHGVTVDG